MYVVWRGVFARLDTDAYGPSGLIFPVYDANACVNYFVLILIFISIFMTQTHDRIFSRMLSNGIWLETIYFIFSSGWVQL